MEIWARCGDCSRWFYCENWAKRPVTAAICPACGAEPLVVVDRASGEVVDEAQAQAGMA